jgi:hypothetical protein
MREEAHPAWSAWLAQRQPATSTKLLSAALAGALDDVLPSPAAEPVVEAMVEGMVEAVVEPVVADDSGPDLAHPLVLGSTVEAGRPAIL